jgi:hypothetical protein
MRRVSSAVWISPEHRDCPTDVLSEQLVTSWSRTWRHRPASGTETGSRIPVVPGIPALSGTGGHYRVRVEAEFESSPPSQLFRSDIRRSGAPGHDPRVLRTAGSRGRRPAPAARRSRSARLACPVSRPRGRRAHLVVERFAGGQIAHDALRPAPAVGEPFEEHHREHDESDHAQSEQQPCAEGASGEPASTC